LILLYLTNLNPSRVISTDQEEFLKLPCPTPYFHKIKMSSNPSVFYATHGRRQRTTMPYPQIKNSSPPFLSPNSSLFE